MSSSELRHTLRRLRRSPGFALVAVAILALGVSGTTTSFSILDTFLLRPLPYDAAQDLVHLYRTDPQSGADELRFSWQFVDALQREERLVEGVGAYVYGGRNLAGGEAEPAHVMVAHLSTEILPLLGVEPVLGRRFRAEEGTSGRDRVVLVGYGVWQRRFGGRPDLVGETLTLDGETHTVIGVMGRHFVFPFGEVRLWVPLQTDPGGDFWDYENLQPVVRLASGVPPEAVRERATELYRRLHLETEGRTGDYGVRVVPLRAALLFFFDLLQTAFWLGLVANGFLLLIICANLANLMLNRAADRRRETALRAVLGASRGQIVRQLVLEGGVLVALGGSLGVALAWWEVRALGGLIPEALYRVGPLAVDGRALLFTLAVCVVTTLAFTLWPALDTSRGDLVEVIRQGGPAASPMRRRMRNVLVVTQVTMAMVLLVGTSLLLQSALHMRAVDPGFDREHVLSMQLRLPELQYPENGDIERFQRQVLDRLGSAAGVESAAFVNPLPLNFESYGADIVVEGRAPRSPDERLSARYHVASPRYFETMGMPLLEGRTFDVTDGAEAEPVAIVNRAFAERHWPATAAVGKRFRTGTAADADQRPFRTVVGVVPSSKNLYVHEDAPPTFFVPMSQVPRRSSFLVVRAQGAPESALKPVREAVWSVQEGLPLAEVRSMEAVVDRSLAPWEGSSLGLVSLGFFALVLAALGLYGVVGYGVSRRTHELGIRLALGAEREQIRWLVLGQGLRLTAIGVGLGLVVSLALGRLLESLLFGVAPYDLETLIAVPLALGAASLLACWLPSRRATRIAPQEALRYE
jgi:predicted permease